MQLIDFELRGEYIALDALLKAVGLATSGGAAKAVVTAGKVQVDGRVELRRSRKVRAAEVVAMHGVRVRVQAAGAAAAEATLLHDEPGPAAAGSGPPV